MQFSISKINHDGKGESGEEMWVGKEKKGEERREEWGNRKEPWRR